MASFFRGILSPTPLQQAIEKATDANRPNEDWGLIMKICDHVGIQEENAKEAMKIIRKRLQINPETNGWRTISLTLTLLEALTKNCGKLFHLQIAQNDFLKEFQGLLAPKNNPPEAIQKTVLGMIQTWALAFQNDPDLKNVEQFYQECQQQGLEFPPAEPENIIKAAVPATGTIERPTQYARTMSQPGSGYQSRSGSESGSQPTGYNQPIVRQMTAEQVAKLRSELDVVQINAQVLGEMLITLQPGEEHPQDLEFLLELHKTCKQMQARIMDLLPQISIDDITVDLLRYNDEFNNSFKTFESYMQERERRVGPSELQISNRTVLPKPTSTATSQSPTAKSSFSQRQQDNEPALIKFDEEPAKLSGGFQNLNVNSTSDGTTIKNIQQQSTTASATTRPVANKHDAENDVKEVEKWLKTQGDTNINANSRDETHAKSAFDEFIDQRAATISDEPLSEKQIDIDFKQPTDKSNA